MYLKSRWGEHKKLHIKIIKKKLSIFDIFCISWGGGHVRGATLTITTTIIITITTSKFLRPLRAETLLVSRLAQGCRKGDPPHKALWKKTWLEHSYKKLLIF